MKLKYLSQNSKMNLVQLLLLTSILSTSCSSIRELSPSYTKTYRITYNYSCHPEYIMAQDANGSIFCVINNAKRFNSLSVSNGSNDSILHDTGRVIRARRGKLKKQTTGKSLTGKNIKKCKN